MNFTIPYGALIALRVFNPPKASAGKNFITFKPRESPDSISVGLLTPGVIGILLSIQYFTTSGLSPGDTINSAPAEKRLKWCQEVFKREGMIVCDYEIRQKRPVYTVETWRELSKLYNLRYLVIGADNLPNIQKWHEFEWLNENVCWIVATRRGHEYKYDMLREYMEITVNIPVSSSDIRRGKGLNYLPESIREEVIDIYNLNPDFAIGS